METTKFDNATFTVNVRVQVKQDGRWFPLIDNQWKKMKVKSGHICGTDAYVADLASRHGLTFNAPKLKSMTAVPMERYQGEDAAGQPVAVIFEVLAN